MLNLLILVSIIAVELVLMAHSLVTKAHQEKVRGIVYLAALAAFTILILLGVVQWSFRWYGLAALLLIKSVFGLWKLRDAKYEVRKYMARTVVTRGIIGAILAFIALIPVLIFPQQQTLPVSGPYTVASARTIFSDENRIEQYSKKGGNRWVSTVFWYPQSENEDGPYPLVVFSHGGLGLESSNETLYRELASHGYVVAAIGHPYHALWVSGEDGRLTFVSMDYFRELQREDAKRDKQQSYKYYQDWMGTRSTDIHFVLNTILEKSAAGADGVYALIDVERIGVMGHSLGGAAALAVPRQRNDIDAVIALESPFLYDITGVENDLFVFNAAPYPVPVLNIYSDSAWEHLSEWPQYARNYKLLSDPPEGAFSVHLSGGGHFSLTDLALASPQMGGRKAGPENAEYLQRVNRTCLDFFDRFLKTGNQSKTYSIHP